MDLKGFWLKGFESFGAFLPQVLDLVTAFGTGREVVMDGSWETLQPDLLELILDRLPVPDYLRFSAVCQQWHRVQTEHRLHRCHTPSAVQMPWLMLPEDYRSPQSRLFYSLSEQRSYRLPIPPLGSQEHLCGTSHGWLLFLYREDDTNLLLLKNLVTGGEIQLPALPRIHIFDHSVALSSSPTDPDCVVLVWDDYCNNYYYCRIRDTKWNESLDDTDVLHASPAICGGKIYMDIGESKLLEVEPCPIPVERSLNMVGLPPCVVCHKYLVESDGELLLARYIKYIRNQENCINMFEIFKADLSRKVWVRLESLGDRVLFLAYGKSFSIRAVDAASPRNKIFHLFNEGTRLEPLWIEYDYENHQVLNGKIQSSIGNVQEYCYPRSMHWLVPSLR